MKKRILIANGVNLDLLGAREEKLYGTFTLVDLEAHLVDFVKKCSASFGCAAADLEFYQSNNEADFIEKCAETGYDSRVINAGAWTHTSLALADRLASAKVKYVEVHISNVHAREPFRHHSYLSAKAKGVVCGLGMQSYTAALLALLLSD
jgi:3-dehydroquinate dehydratase-2